MYEVYCKRGAIIIREFFSSIVLAIEYAEIYTDKGFKVDIIKSNGRPLERLED